MSTRRPTGRTSVTDAPDVRLNAARVESAAIGALVDAGCDVVHLFVPLVSARLVYDAARDEVAAVDEDGSPMYGGTARHVVASLRRAYPQFFGPS